MSSLRDLLDSACKQLINSDSARLDAELIMCEILGRDRAWLFTWPEHKPEPNQVVRFQKLVERRIAGEPVAHILARREFWGLDLECSKHTLIPRPETELLVESALSLELPNAARVLDLGTGTGAIALALASEQPGWKIVAVDIVSEAIALARRNEAKVGVQNIVDWRCGGWFEPVEGEPRFNLIVSNPPYVEENSEWLEKGDLRFEPRSALTAGADGLRDIRYIVDQAASWLEPQGALLIEHGFTQANAVREIFGLAGFVSIDLIQDYSGLDRVTLGFQPDSPIR